jgi:hypothetical protein
MAGRERHRGFVRFPAGREVGNNNRQKGGYSTMTVENSPRAIRVLAGGRQATPATCPLLRAHSEVESDRMKDGWVSSPFLFVDAVVWCKRS